MSPFSHKKASLLKWYAFISVKVFLDLPIDLSYLKTDLEETQGQSDRSLFLGSMGGVESLGSYRLHYLSFFPALHRL